MARLFMGRLLPLVTRRRFVRELEEQGEAYRANVLRAEHDKLAAQRRLEEAENSFANIVNSLQGWREGDTLVSFQSADPHEPVRMMGYRVVGDYTRDCVVFSTMVSNSMLTHMLRTLHPREIEMTLEMITKRLVMQMLRETVEPTQFPRKREA